ncbi:MAG: twin-arginine translocase subunit TatB [Gammaproteobacteria bacterium HGW-Gammaproteobacteria-8]|nr:MAG: twin-arginine translocase subunit TatB [Gammaproteobacteria bacterium HGW-Gammaproteobacteria-8]
MNGVGFTEMLLLAIIALIVVGPHKLPKIARTAGRLSRQARNAWQNLQSELQSELDAEHNRKIIQAHPEAGNSDTSSESPTAGSDEPRRDD